MSCKIYLACVKVWQTKFTLCVFCICSFSCSLRFKETINTICYLSRGFTHSTTYHEQLVLLTLKLWSKKSCYKQFSIIVIFPLSLLRKHGSWRKVHRGKSSRTWISKNVGVSEVPVARITSPCCFKKAVQKPKVP